jgi:drug/metabolite transporter (DMT)-like permease
MKTESQHSSSALGLRAVAVMVVLCASWGLQQVAVKVANQGVSPVLQCGIRSIGAAMMIATWMVIRRKPLFEKDGTWWWGFAAGLLFTGEFILIYWGLDFTNASRAVIFLYTSPFVVALGAQFLIPGEHLRPLQIIGLFCAFAGIAIAFRDALQFPTYRMLIGDSMLAGAAVLWGATTVLIKVGPLSKIRPDKTLLYQLAVSAVVLPLASAAMGEPGVIRISPLIAGCLVYQVVWVAFITYLTWFWLICRYPVSRLASFTFLTPFFGVLAGAVLLDEVITKSLVAALVLVAAGIYLVNRPKANRKGEISMAAYGRNEEEISGCSVDDHTKV